MKDQRSELRQVHLRDFEPVSENLLRAFPAGLIRKDLVVPIARKEGRLVAAACKPDAALKLEGLKVLAGCPVDLVLAPIDEIIDFIRLHYPETRDVANHDEAPFARKLSEAEPPPPVMEAARAPASWPPSFQGLLDHAAQNNAAEVLIEYDGARVRVRERIRGVLVTARENAWTQSDVDQALSALRRVGETRTGNELRWGQARFDFPSNGKSWTVSAAFSATGAFGLITLQLRPAGEARFAPEDWGMGPNQARLLEGFLASRQGIVLFCGTEWDGVGAQARACARQLATPERSVVAVESFLEQPVTWGAHLVANADPLLFDQLLRLAFRHAPDAALVNPLSGKENVDLCFEEAMRGRLILARTLARDSADAIVQLLSMGVEPYVVGSGLLGVVAQRRLRLICPRCQEKEHVAIERLSEIGIPVAMHPPAFFRGKGCDACCRTGFDRETTIFEALAMSDELRYGLAKGMKIESVRQILRQSGMLTLRQIAVHKAVNGQTSLSEVLRVTS